MVRFRRASASGHGPRRSAAPESETLSVRLARRQRYYEITLVPPANAKGVPETCLVEINGRKTPYHFKAAPNAKAAPEKIVVSSDGKRAISGTVWK